MRVFTFYLLFCAKAAQDFGEEEGGDGEAPQGGEEEEEEEDEGRDSGGDFEEKEPEGEPYESQETSDSGHGVPDFTADEDLQKSDGLFEAEAKPDPTETNTARGTRQNFVDYF